MQNLSRRHLLASGAALLAGCHRKPRKQVDVVFHGMFAFVQDSSGIHVHAPHCGDHVYQFGPLGNQHEIGQNTVIQCRLNNRFCAPPEKVELEDMPIFTAYTGIDGHYRHFTMDLPPPDDFRVYREASATISGPIKGNTACLLVRFIYYVSPRGGMTFTMPSYSYPGPSTRLHFHAEPDKVFTDSTHVNDALQQLASMLCQKTSFELKSYDCPPDPSDEDGLSAEDERSLDESRGIPCKINRGSSVPHCYSVAVDVGT